VEQQRQQLPGVQPQQQQSRQQEQQQWVPVRQNFFASQLYPNVQGLSEQS
jgi:hypothetical protein